MSEPKEEPTSPESSQAQAPPAEPTTPKTAAAGAGTTANPNDSGPHNPNPGGN